MSMEGLQGSRGDVIKRDTLAASVKSVVILV